MDVSLIGPDRRDTRSKILYLVSVGCDVGSYPLSNCLLPMPYKMLKSQKFYCMDVSVCILTHFFFAQIKGRIREKFF